MIRVLCGLCLLLLWPSPVAAALPAPEGLRITCVEKAIDLSWDAVPGAVGYNVYTAPRAGLTTFEKTRANVRLITSGSRFTLIWLVSEGRRERCVKGYRHFLSVTAVDSIGNRPVDGMASLEVDNNYFRGYDTVRSPDDVKRIVSTPPQRQAPIPLALAPCSRRELAAFLSGPGRQLMDSVHALIDPRQLGGCTPLSTVLVKLLQHNGIAACRADGTFIEEFHSFAIVNVDGVECVIDIAADQFVPGVAPVLVPRDRCFLDPATGGLDEAGRPVYLIGKLFRADDIGFSETEEAGVYRRLLDALIAAD